MFPRNLFATLALCFPLILAGCSSNDPTMIPEDPDLANASDVESSFPDADANELKEMEEAAASGETP